MPNTDPYPYVYVNADGSARELHESERRYLETEFKGGDGAAPYIKSSYEERDGWHRSTATSRDHCCPKAPRSTMPPAEDPIRPMNRQGYIAWLRNKGMEVTEKRDGSVHVIEAAAR